MKRDAFVEMADILHSDTDRLSFLDSQNAYIELGKLVGGKRVAEVGQVCAIGRDELGWIAYVKTQHAFTLDYEFPTFRHAVDFAMTKAGLDG
jgi:hypothetical protein